MRRFETRRIGTLDIVSVGRGYGETMLDNRTATMGSPLTIVPSVLPRSCT